MTKEKKGILKHVTLEKIVRLMQSYFTESGQTEDNKTLVF